jgi:hypothetical protein
MKRGGPGPRVVLLLVIAGEGLDFAGVHRVADGVAVIEEAVLEARALARDVRVHDPVDAGPAAEPLRRHVERLDLDVISLGVFGDLHQIRVEGVADHTEHVVLFVDVDGVVAEDGLGLDDEVERGGDCAAAGQRGILELAQNVGVDLAVHHLARGFLHHSPAVTLRSEQVERGTAHQVVPLNQGAGVLVEIVGAGRDEAVDAAGVRGRAAGVGDKEDRLIALVLGLRQDGVTEVGYPLLEAHDRFLAVLDLKCSVSH